jgi:flagellar biosynthetic protein FlhB
MKAREKGDFATSRHLLGAFQFLIVVALISRSFGDWCTSMARIMVTLFRRSMMPGLNAADIIHLFRQAVLNAVSGIAIGALALLALAVLGQLLVTGFGISSKKLAPDLNKLNPVAKLQGMFRNNFMNAGQALVLIPLFLYVVFRISWDNLHLYLILPHMPTTAAIVQIGLLVKSLMWKAGTLFLVVGVVDFAFEKNRYTRNLRMSKQDIKDEVKETEGNVEMKNRIKRLIRSMGRRRMLKDVKTATAVIVNPTHYAVALRYEADSKSAPLVVAKGKNYLALKIRAAATEHGIAIVENPPLAQSLYASVEVGQEIPVHLYRAVAEVLAHVYKLMQSYRPSHLRQ